MENISLIAEVSIATYRLSLLANPTKIKGWRYPTIASLQCLAMTQVLFGQSFLKTSTFYEKIQSSI